MSGGPQTARRLLEGAGEHPVVSLYFDLDPEQFATAPARASQARALIDEAHRAAEAEDGLSHDERSALSEDLERIDALLGADDLPVSGARGLAVFASGADDLLETVPLTEAVGSAVFIDRRPHVEPLVTGAGDERWCAALVSTRDAEIYLGRGQDVAEHHSLQDYVRGRGNRGATARNTEEQDIEGHLIQLADTMYRDWQKERFALLALAGPHETTAHLRELLHNDLRPVLADEPLAVDESAATEADVRDAVAALFAVRHERRAAEALAQLDDTTRAVRGLAETLQALTERRVQTLLLSRDFAAAGGRCPNDGMLVPEGTQSCPADGATVAPVADLREAAVQEALAQDAEVIALDQPRDELPAAHPIAALLRF